MITKALYSQTRSATIYGELESGLGEGAWYISQEEYSTQFEEVLGFVPFPGTLNLRILNVDDLKKIAQIRQSEPYIIHGFEKKGRNYGDVMCYKCRFIDGTVGAIIIPSRTHHNKDILEAIAPINNITPATIAAIFTDNKIKGAATSIIIGKKRKKLLANSFIPFVLLLTQVNNSAKM